MLSQGTHNLILLVGREDVVEDKADHNSLEMLWVDLPLPGRSSDQGSDQGSHQLTLPRGSKEGNRHVWIGRGPRVKVNILIFKDQKTKDAVTYCLW